MASKVTKKGMSRGARTAVGVGAALAVAAAVAAGVHLMSGKRGVKNRAKMKGWALKARAEIRDQVEKLKTIDKEAYHAIVDGVTRRYRGVKNVDPEEIRAMTAELKGHWSNIHKQVAAGMKKPAGSARERAARTTRKAPRTRVAAVK
jgi:hypothetical protein